MTRASAHHDGEFASQDAKDRQVIRQQDGAYSIYPKQNGKFTGEVRHYYPNGRLEAQLQLDPHQPGDSRVTGRYITYKRNGRQQRSRLAVLDFARHQRIIYQKDTPQDVWEITELNRPDHSLKQTARFYNSGRLASLHRYQDNAYHETGLYFFNGAPLKKEERPSFVKRNLRVYQRYDRGFLEKEMIYNLDGNHTYTMEYDRDDPDNTVYTAVSYDNGTAIYTIGDAYQGLLRQDFRYATELVKSIQYDPLKRISQIDLFVKDRDHKNRLVSDHQVLIANDWNAQGQVQGGMIKTYCRDTLTANGPFRSQNGQFAKDGCHVMREGIIYEYNMGKVEMTRRENVWEENGLLITQEIKDKHRLLCDNAPHLKR